MSGIVGRLSLAVLACVLGVSQAVPAVAMTGIESLQDIKSCFGHGSEAACLLRISAVEDAGASIIYDVEFLVRPEVFSEAGVTEAGVLQRWRQGDASAPQFFDVTGFLARRAVWRAMVLDRSGSTPALAVQPLLEIAPLPGDEGDLDHTPQQRAHSARLRAFHDLWALAYDRYRRVKGITPSEGLVRRAVGEWEAELRAEPHSDDGEIGALGLIKVYSSLGDILGAERAIALDSPKDDLSRMYRLVLAGKLNQAAAISSSPDMRRVEADMLQAEIVRRSEEQRRMQKLLGRFADQLSAGVGPATSQPQAAAALQRLRSPDLPAPNMEEVRRQVHEQAAIQLQSTRTELMKAAVEAQRWDIAVPVAQALIDGGARGSDKGQALTVLVQHASQLVAEHAIETAERQGPGELDLFALEWPFKAWIVLGRPDRAEAFLSRWRPEARAQAVAFANARAGGQELWRVRTDIAAAVNRVLLDEDREEEAKQLGYVSPYDLLNTDVERGRGITQLPGYYAAAVGEQQRDQLLDTCAFASSARKAWADAGVCLEYSRKGEPAVKAVSLALRTAAAAGRADAVAPAKRILAMAADEVASVPQAQRSQTFALLTADVKPALVALAKAELGSIR